MNTALIKDILREIRKSLGRFLSILLIVALGVALLPASGQAFRT